MRHDFLSHLSRPEAQESVAPFDDAPVENGRSPRFRLNVEGARVEHLEHFRLVPVRPRQVPLLQ